MISALGKHDAVECFFAVKNFDKPYFINFAVSVVPWRHSSLPALFVLSTGIRALQKSVLVTGDSSGIGRATCIEKGVRIDPGIADRLRAMGYLR